MLADERLIPKRLVGKERQNRIAVFVGFGLDRPPEEKRNVNVIQVFAPLREPLDDRQRLSSRQPAGGASELAADFDVGFAVGEVGEFFGESSLTGYRRKRGGWSKGGHMDRLSSKQR